MKFYCTCYENDAQITEAYTTFAEAVKACAKHHGKLAYEKASWGEWSPHDMGGFGIIELEADSEDECFEADIEDWA